MSPTDQATTTPVTVLLVDDEEAIRELARLVLERAGLSVLDEAEDGLAALESFHGHNPPSTPLVVLLDNRMPGLTGLEVAQEILGAFPTQIVVLFSAHLTDETAAEAKRLGVSACLAKTEVLKLPSLIEELVASA
jgi:two-component system chemotaxis response regulator CheY